MSQTRQWGHKRDKPDINPTNATETRQKPDKGDIKGTNEQGFIMNYWWTSDYHFGHANIIKYCNRPFETVEEMNEVIIRKHNERVKPEDTVFFLGDFIFKGGKEGGESD